MLEAFADASSARYSSSSNIMSSPVEAKCCAAVGSVLKKFVVGGRVTIVAGIERPLAMSARRAVLVATFSGV